MPRVVDISPRILPRAVNRPGLAEGIGSGLELLAADRREKQALELRAQERGEDRDAIIDAIEARGGESRQGIELAGELDIESARVRAIVEGEHIDLRGGQQRQTLGFADELAAPQRRIENVFEGERIGIAGEAQQTRDAALQADIERGRLNEEGRNERQRLSLIAGGDSFPLKGLAGQLTQQGLVTNIDDAITVARGRAPGGTVRSPTDLPGDAVRQFEAQPGGFIRSKAEADELNAMTPEEHVQIGLFLLASPAEFQEYLDALNPELAAQVEQLVEAEARRRDNPQGRR